MLDFFSQNIREILINLDLSLLNEIRLRNNYPIICNYNFNKYYLNKDGLTQNKNNLILACNKDIKHVIEYLTENSIYAFNDYIKNGFLTSKNGVRVGICGTCVFNDNKITTIKDIQSLCIRFPHNVIGCSNEVYNKILEKNNANILIISPPGYGKTTILKDLIRNFNQFKNLNLLVINERGELDVKGENVDIINYSNKEYSLKYAIRSMAPDVIFMDELIDTYDFEGIYKASCSGINVIATIHASNVNDAVNKYNKIKEIFDYFVVLKKGERPGEILGIYDNNLYEI